MRFTRDQGRKVWEERFEVCDLESKAFALLAAQWAERMEPHLEEDQFDPLTIEQTALNELSKLWPVTNEVEAKNIISKFCSVLQRGLWYYHSFAFMLATTFEADVIRGKA